MTDRYRHLAEPVDRQQAEELRRQLHARLGQGPAEPSPDPIAPDDQGDLLTEEPTMPTDLLSRPTRRRSLIFITTGVVLAAAAAIAVAVIVNGDDAAAPRDTAPASTAAPATTTTPTTLAQPTTTTVRLTDFQIADATLLYMQEYGLGWDTAQWKTITLDRAVAAPIPGCAPYLDIAFESAARPASVASKWFHKESGTLEVAMSQYVVVFPDDSAAKAMYQAITSEDFLTKCMADYQVRKPETEFAALASPNADPPALGLAGDEASLAVYDGSLSGLPAGLAQPGERVLNARIRVGRVVIVLEGADASLQTQTEFEAAVAKAVQRARAALAGTPLRG